MHHYLIAAIIFKDGQVRDGVNCIYRSEAASDIIDFKNHIAGNYAGPRETYSAIFISSWYEISEEAYRMYQGKFSEDRLQKISEANS